MVTSSVTSEDVFVVLTCEGEVLLSLKFPPTKLAVVLGKEAEELVKETVEESAVGGAVVVLERTVSELEGTAVELERSIVELKWAIVELEAAVVKLTNGSDELSLFTVELAAIVELFIVLSDTVCTVVW